jgi:DNA adenine methylase
MGMGMTASQDQARGYPGAKSGSGVYQAIISQMPPHDTYIETHFGMGAIMRNKPCAVVNIGIERDALIAEAARIEMARQINSDQPYLPLETQIITGRAEDYLRSFDFADAGRVLVYADPPYIRGPGEVRGDRQLYRHEYSRSDHVELITLLRELPCAVMLSGYPSSLYDDLLGDWRKIEFQAMTRGGPRTECLWMNFPAGAVQWASFAGKNRDVRQRIKRKAATWRRRYERMAPGERLAVLAALMGVQETTTAVEDNCHRWQSRPTAPDSEARHDAKHRAAVESGSP